MTTPSTGARAAAKLATRDALIDAALTEFIEHGPSTPSLDAICDRAGYTRGAFYVHFKDREDLLVAVMDRVLGDLVRNVGAADGTLAGGIRHFSAQAAARSPAVHPDRGLRFHHVLEACRASKKIGDRYRLLLGAGKAWTQHAITQEKLAVDASAGADVLLATALGLLVLLELDMPVDPSRFGEALIALVTPRTPAPRASSKRGRSRTRASRRARR